MVRLVVHGELDMATAPALRSRIEAVERRSTPVVGVDLSDLSFMDVSGIRVLVDAARRAKAQGRKIVVLNPRRPIQRLLELTAVDTVLEVSFE